jgi:hypothetical protein
MGKNVECLAADKELGEEVNMGKQGSIVWWKIMKIVSKSGSSDQVLGHVFF